MPSAQEMIQKLALFGVGTRESLIYGDVGTSAYNFIFTKDESSRMQSGHDRHGNPIFRRSDWRDCETINNLVYLGIFERFYVYQPGPESRYKSKYFYKLSDDFRNILSGATDELHEEYCKELMEIRYRKSGTRRVCDQSSKLELSIASLARTHLGYTTETVSEILKENPKTDSIDNVLDRTTKNGNTLRELIDSLGGSRVYTYFEVRNILDLNSNLRMEIFMKLVRSSDSEREDMFNKVDEILNKKKINEQMGSDGITEYYVKHRDSLKEFVKRSTELDKIEVSQN